MRINKLTGLVMLCFAFFSSDLVAQENKFSLSSYGDELSSDPDKFFYFNELEGVLFLNGTIEKGMYTNFRQAITENKIHTIVLNSLGGNVEEGLNIAGTVFDKGIKTYIPKGYECYSACSFIFLAGSEKYALGELGVHQAAYADDVSKEKAAIGAVTTVSQLTTADILLRLGEFNTPRFVEQRMLRTAPEDMYVFNSKELNKLGNLDVSNNSKALFKNIDKFIDDLQKYYAEQDCDNDVKKCTSTQLCQRAATDKSWNKATNATKYVIAAKGKGLTCGVPTPVCPEDIKKCNEEYLCTYGTKSINTGLSWLNNTFAVEAKSRGLSCGVKKTKVPYACNKDPEKCNVGPLCDFATDNTYSGPIWKKSLYWEKHVAEAKKRGLSCGVKKTNVVTEKATCADEPKNCTIALLCQITTNNYADGKVWNKNPYWKKHVSEAKRRGLSCGVKKTKAPYACNKDPKQCNVGSLCDFATDNTESGPIWKKSLYWEKHVAEAKKRGLLCGVKDSRSYDVSLIMYIQTYLNKLGCNAGTADGILGRKTLSALKRWKSAGGNYTPNKIDQRLRSSLFESPYECSSVQTSNTPQASPGLLSGIWDVTYSRCDNNRYKSILKLYSSKSNEYEAIYNVQNRIYKGKLKITGDKYSIALKGPRGLVSGNGILNKSYTRAQGRDHMGCLFDATKR